jgi:hypothetical protein
VISVPTPQLCGCACERCLIYGDCCQLRDVTWPGTIQWSGTGSPSTTTSPAMAHVHRWQRLSDVRLFCECGEIKGVAVGG